MECLEAGKVKELWKPLYDLGRDCGLDESEVRELLDRERRIRKITLEEFIGAIDGEGQKKRTQMQQSTIAPKSSSSDS